MSEHTPGAQIRGARNAAGLTLEQLAGRIGISSATLSLIERGKVGITDQRLGEIADQLGTTSAAMGQREHGGTAVGSAAKPGTREQVMRAAIDCFVARGYHGTSMREIAQAGRVSVAGVYHYFDSKQALLVAISQHTMDQLLGQLNATLDAAQDAGPGWRFHELVRAMAHFHIVERDLGFIGASERRSLEEPDGERLTALRRRAQEMLDVQARAAAEAGDFTTNDVMFAARNVANMCTSLSQWFNPDGRLSAEQAACHVADYAVAMMRS